MYSKLHREGEGDHPLQSDGWWNDSPSREVPIPKWQNALFTLWRVIFHPLCLRFKGSFVLDVRSIAFYRIVMGLTVIGDLIDRGRDLIFHYTDDGIMPRDLSIVWQNDQWYSVYNITGAQTGHPFEICIYGTVNRTNRRIYFVCIARPDCVLYDHRLALYALSNICLHLS